MEELCRINERMGEKNNIFLDLKIKRNTKINYKCIFRKSLKKKKEIKSCRF
jgi:hypothetical protein